MKQDETVKHANFAALGAGNVWNAGTIFAADFCYPFIGTFAGQRS
ncbi:MAG: hypothetical protein ABL952_18250 [Pyrinomonadaceae bacterium]